MGRKKLDRQEFHARVAPETVDRLKNLAASLGYQHGGQGSIAQVLDAVAQGKIILVPTDKILDNIK
ncbi:hypothetical protein [Chamaesiphon sp.]|uniref:hypothetical protein n=1 Tax=Chamaesiphon sp. TaxID=2814140 RepID=UPI00359470A4